MPTRSVDEFLSAIGLERYVASFASNDVDFAALRLLNDSDLHLLGGSLGHRKKLLQAIANLSTNAVSAPYQSDRGEVVGGAPSGAAERR